MTVKPNQLPTWAESPASGFPGAADPGATLLDNGFDNGEEPTAGHFNWLFRELSRWTRYLDGSRRARDIAHAVKTAKVVSFTDVAGMDTIHAIGCRPGLNHGLPLGDWDARGPAICIAGHNASNQIVIAIGEPHTFNFDSPSGGPYTETPTCVAFAVADSGSWPTLVFIGCDAGRWFIYPSSGGGEVTGNIAGDPSIYDAVFDASREVWWLATASGIYSGEFDLTPTFTQRQAGVFYRVAIHPVTNRVVALRSDGVLMYADAVGGFTAGEDSTIATPSAPSRLAATADGFLLAGQTRVVHSEDGTAITMLVGAGGTLGESMNDVFGALVSSFAIGGKFFLALDTAHFGGFLPAGALTDWFYCPGPYSDEGVTIRPAAACPDRFVWRQSFGSDYLLAVATLSLAEP